MAAQSYIQSSDKRHCEDTFGNFKFDRFLTIPHKQAMVEYTETFVKQHHNPITFDKFLAIPYKEATVKHGDTFAVQHRKLCDTLRVALMRKYMADQRESTSQTPGTGRFLEVDNLALNVKSLSLTGQQGVKTTIIMPFPDSGQMLSTPTAVVSVKRRQGVRMRTLTPSSGSGQRVSVKDRLGVKIRTLTPFSGSGQRVSVKDRLGVKIRTLTPFSGSGQRVSVKDRLGG